jgi:NAD(P) transhydrogenase subunit beta
MPVNNTYWIINALAFLIGFTLIIPIGGADMPVAVSTLNSYSGWAAWGIGFTLSNSALIITGALVGSFGGILSYTMCKGMNRSIFNVFPGSFGADAASGGAATKGERSMRSGTDDDAASIMFNASKALLCQGMAWPSPKPSMHC